MFRTTASLLLSTHAATVIGATTVRAYPASLVFTSHQANISSGILINAACVSFTLAPYSADIKYDVNVNAFAAALVIAAHRAQIVYPVNVSASYYGFLLASYPAAVWDGAAWAKWIAANARKLTRRYYFVLTGDGDGTTDITIPISSGRPGANRDRLPSFPWWSRGRII